MSRLRAMILAGLALMIIVLGLFFFEWRSVVISIVVVPVTLVTAAFILHQRGEPFNALLLAGLVVALVIVIEVIRTIVMYLVGFLTRGPRETTVLRFRLGQSMVMGLEFQVAADILKTALSPQWNDILLLAALIGMRTLLNYLLERELESLDAATVLSTGYASPLQGTRRKRSRGSD